jgi:DNA mismatch repair protein MutS2
MDDRSLKALDFYHLLDTLKEYTTSSHGRKRCETLRPSRDLPCIRTRLAEVGELREILETTGDIPIQGIQEMDEILRKLGVEESVLTVQELLVVHAQIVLVAGLKRFFQRLERGRTPHLYEKASRLSSLRSLEKEILRTVNTKGEILDEASPGLLEIRHRLRAARERVHGVLEHLLHRADLQPVFQDQFITLRNGRYVLPVKSDAQPRFEGIVHDQSQSRMTLFIEPLQVVSLNNEINMLVGEEREEEYRILSDLSRKVREESQALWSDDEILGDLDLLYAIARLSIQFKCIPPLLNEGGRIDMKAARHPLLLLQKGEGCVPIDLRLGDGIKAIIISGANAGGKTVALKTLGLLTLMVQCGLPIPVADGSEVCVFQDVLALIGDEQNIEENLSTFSSHLVHLNEILKKADARTLILLDELGVGTHASEGCALAMGFLDQLRAKGATIGVSTHFDGLKVYGYRHADVENVAVEFDEVTLEPKYKLSYGMSGLSNAFLIAEKFGVPTEVLERARHYQDGGEQEVARTLQTLEKLKGEARKERQNLLDLQAAARAERQRLEEILQEIRRKRKEISLRAEERAKRAAQKVEEELKEWVRRQKVERKQLASPSRIGVSRKEIQEIKERFFPTSRQKKEREGKLRIGDRVRVEPLGRTGVLSKMEEPLKRVEVLTERGTIKASLSDVVKICEEEKKEEVPPMTYTSRDHAQEAPSQVNIIGLTVEDALPIVDKFIDQALLHGLEKVQIVHGIGTGRLRDAIGQYLREHRGVRSFGPGDPMRGGGGITLVELR